MCTCKKENPMAEIFDTEKTTLWECIDKSVTNAVIPAGIEIIWDEAFRLCDSLKSAVIPDSVTEIRRKAFMNCKNLSSVTIGAGVQRIYPWAFKGCDSLKSVEFAGTMEQWDAIQGKDDLFCEVVPATSVKCADGVWQKPLVLVEHGIAVRYLDYAAESAEIPDDITKFSKKAFRSCKDLRTIKLGDNIKELPSEAFTGLPENFEIICSENSTTYKTLKKSPRLREHVKSLAKEDAKDKKIAQLQQATADGLITSLFEKKSDCNVFTINATKNATTVLVRTGANSAVFKLGADCSKWLGKAKTCIDAMQDSSKSGAEIYEVIKSTNLPLSSIPKKMQKDLKLKTDADDNLRLFCKGEVNEIFPENTKTVELFGSMQIGCFAFNYFKELSSAVIGEDVTKIEWNAFNRCKQLSKLEISSSVEEIGRIAFEKCSIEEFSHPCLYIKNGLAIKDDKVLYLAANNKTEIVIPDGITEIESEAFKECLKLSSIVIPKSVSKIGYKAFDAGWFKDRSSLNSIVFGGTVAEWLSVEKGDSWNEGVPAKFVKCSDGKASL